MSSLADLKVSQCGRFALLYNSTGVYFIVWSKKYARHMVDEGARFQVIIPTDVDKLRSQIDSSSLPENDESVSDEVKLVITNFNETRFEIPDCEISEEEITKVLDSIERIRKSKMN
jgi:hypothetical protein